MSELAGIAERVLQRFAALRFTSATAGSCTAGCLATLLADAPGAGKHFNGRFVDAKPARPSTECVLGRTPHPALMASEADRVGYVPNVVYTCGATKIGDSLFMPYGFSDSGASASPMLTFASYCPAWSSRGPRAHVSE